LDCAAKGDPTAKDSNQDASNFSIARKPRFEIRPARYGRPNQSAQDHFRAMFDQSG
jgi:hypothetical protein